MRYVILIVDRVGTIVSYSAFTFVNFTTLACYAAFHRSLTSPTNIWQTQRSLVPSRIFPIIKLSPESCMPNPGFPGFIEYPAFDQSTAHLQTAHIVYKTLEIID